jgi:ATP-dependent DNA helicase DinG
MESRHIGPPIRDKAPRLPYHCGQMSPSPSLVAAHGRAVILTPDGEFLSLPAEEAAHTLRGLPPPLVVHAPATFRRLGLRSAPAALDVLELFAFVCPAKLTAPTPRGLALALDLAPPTTLEDAAALLPDLADALLNLLHAGRDLPLNAHAAGLAARMGRARWGWAKPILLALGSADQGLDGFKPWRKLAEWDDLAPPPAPASHPVPPAEARARLASILGPGAEQRPGQADYAHAAAAAFAPREVRGDPHVVLAEAGTGTGKTLGYIAPASLWAERNHGAVWISTFTKHLQRQIDGELARLHPNGAERRRRVVVRKGRENYVCLLNLEDTINMALTGAGANLIPIGLLARWALATADGDLFGGDLPGWFAELFGGALAVSVADRRGECIHGACTHYKKCFIEHTVRRARTADLVVANHALVMTQAAWGGLDDDTVPTRYVFDEGHHLFEAADSAFASEISGTEGSDLRRWLLGAEGGRSRARGLKRRLDELVVGHADLEAPLEAILLAARALPAPGWSLRLGDDAGPDMAGLSPGQPNPFEFFLGAARRQVLARIAGEPEFGQRATMEVDLFPVTDDVRAAAPALARGLGRIAAPVKTLLERLEDRLEDEAEELDPTTRSRIDAAVRGLRRRALDRLTIWQNMLGAIGDGQSEPGDRPSFIHFLRLDRRENADRDVSYCRHHLDPTLPFATTLASPAHGMLITSATLRDATGGEAEADWEAAEARVGASHLPSPAYRAALGSPFDYAQQTRAFVVTDVSADIGALAGAYRALFMAAGGGALGLFTAIGRLKAVHGRIAGPLDEAGISLLAQHVDPMDNATLVDIFRTEENSCLLGTDAMRDGVDVPGRALRLVVFERTPWPRPDILHRERRIHLSGGDPTAYDDRIARLRLRQAFGRLIRTGTDRGVFVLLDRRTPTRLLSAFPPGVEVRRAGLAETITETAAFLGNAVSARPG